MLKRKNQITLCVASRYAVDMERFTNDIKTYGVIENYIRDDEIYVTFTARMTAEDVGKDIESKFNAKTNIQGNVIFIEM